MDRTERSVVVLRRALEKAGVRHVFAARIQALNLTLSVASIFNPSIPVHRLVTLTRRSRTARNMMRCLCLLGGQ